LLRSFFTDRAVALVAFFLFFRKWRWYSAYILLATAGSTLMNQYLKNNFGTKAARNGFLSPARF
jgi:hypothetical protein